MKRPESDSYRKQQITALRARQAEALASHIVRDALCSDRHAGDEWMTDPEGLAEWLIEHYIVVPRSSPK